VRAWVVWKKHQKKGFAFDAVYVPAKTEKDAREYLNVQNYPRAVCEGELVLMDEGIKVECRQCEWNGIRNCADLVGCENVIKSFNRDGCVVHMKASEVVWRHSR